jgi:flagellar biosynthesis protein FliR
MTDLWLSVSASIFGTLLGCYLAMRSLGRFIDKTVKDSFEQIDKEQKP